MKIKASAPGSLMLLGEYAVLHGKYAVVCAVNKRVTVSLTPRTDERIIIRSSLYGEYETKLSKLKVEAPYQFVLAAIKQHLVKFKKGCELEISSDFSDKMGLGSSAAVTVATLGALYTWLKIKIHPRDIVKQGRLIVRSVQGTGSGADIAASVMGGMIGYQAQPFFLEKFSYLQPITLIYSGFKTKTADAIEKVQQQFSSHPQLFRQITNGIGQCAIEGMKCIQREEWVKLGEIMNIQQGLMESLGVSLPILREMIESLRAHPNMLGAKISGSGLGDCVIGLGEAVMPAEADIRQKKVQIIPVEMSLQGMSCEKV